jgi:hypothetical protein
MDETINKNKSFWIKNNTLKYPMIYLANVLIIQNYDGSKDLCASTNKKLDLFVWI